MNKFINRLRGMRNDTGGYIIVIAVGLAALLMFFSIELAITINKTQQDIKASNNQMQAYFVEQSLEATLLNWGNKQEAGISLNKEQCKDFWDAKVNKMLQLHKDVGSGIYVCDEPSNSYCAYNLADRAKITVTCEVQGLSNTPIEGYYTIPAANMGGPGGNLVGMGGPGGNCSPERPVYFDSLDPDTREMLGDSELNHPCDWGALNFGNSYTSRVALPLYYQSITGVNPDGTITNFAIINPIDTDTQNSRNNSLGELKIRVRTPCKPIAERTYDRANSCVITEPTTGRKTIVNNSECKQENICSDWNRYELDPGDGTRNAKQNATVVNWQIQGECDKQTCAITPDISVLSAETGRRDTSKNSEIYESFINAKGEIDLTKSSNAYGFTETKPSIGNFIKSPDIEKPVLQLSIISNGLIDTTGKRIPNLEYQILSDQPIANSAQNYIGTVFYNGQAYTFRKVINQKKDVVDFAVQN